MIEELIGWAIAIFLLVIIFSLLRKIFFGKKANKNDILMSDSDVNHLGPFSGQFKFKDKKNLQIALLCLSFSLADASEKENLEEIYEKALELEWVNLSMMYSSFYIMRGYFHLTDYDWVPINIFNVPDENNWEEVIS